VVELIKRRDEVDFSDVRYKDFWFRLFQIKGVRIVYEVISVLNKISSEVCSVDIGIVVSNITRRTR
jgi:hypothetical protein